MDRHWIVAVHQHMPTPLAHSHNEQLDLEIGGRLPLSENLEYPLLGILILRRRSLRTLEMASNRRGHFLAPCTDGRSANPTALASSGYLELGMLDDAALALEEIEPEDKTRTEVLGARIALYVTAKKWDMAAAVASHLVKVDPQTAGWWISLAYSLRRTESVEKAEAILLRAQAIHPKVAMIAFNLACYASVTGRMEEARKRLRLAIDLDKDVRLLAIDDEDLKPLWDWIGGLK